MEFLRSVVPFQPAPMIATETVILRAPTMADYGAWSDLRGRSRDFLMPWEPVWPIDDLTRAAFRRRLRRYQRELNEATGFPFLVFRTQDLALVGGLTLSHVVRGVTQSCSLGYWMGEPFAGKGLMTAAAKSVIPFVFDTLRLHRLEAACLPHNAASIRLLEKAGFTREGYARRYLCIDGRWQDHLLFAIVADDPRP
ncbi:30S ribosomal protein S5 alanine N-acetyltransferase [Kaistia algarum]|jgi:ribosomal-protein-alanine N-acetyltransferase|uniref:GNAT family N-acetyltransferase n=1 Tax=Kaistia algarum TaxID=2083279 RepID=UPI000CE78504|nr:GNAT family protein [Kaistia algarum]MCX5512368.1 GNAT family protein [Kaistia algarum]PPE80451.1 30S ribosomal protein S5 alanine N-acetyltransferase [Kaistia algarum]